MGKKKKVKKPKAADEVVKKTPKAVESEHADPHTAEGVRELFGTCDPDDKHFT